MNKTLLLACMCAFGCAPTIKSVEIAQPLPIHIHRSEKFIPQVHYLTDEEMKYEVEQITLLDNKLEEDLDVFAYYHARWMVSDFKALIKKIMDNIEHADTEEELIFYRRLFLKCSALKQRMMDDLQKSTVKVKELWQEFYTHKRYQ